jgi:hypothetical protein
MQVFTTHIHVILQWYYQTPATAAVSTDSTLKHVLGKVFPSPKKEPASLQRWKLNYNYP